MCIAPHHWTTRGILLTSPVNMELESDLELNSYFQNILQQSIQEEIYKEMQYQVKPKSLCVAQSRFCNQICSNCHPL